MPTNTYANLELLLQPTRNISDSACKEGNNVAQTATELNLGANVGFLSVPGSNGDGLEKYIDTTMQYI